MPGTKPKPARDKKQKKERTVTVKLNRKVSIILLTAGLAVFVWKGNAQTPEGEIEVARGALKADHRATLQFEDGSTKTVAVRPDVDLNKRKVGDKVVIRITEALAIRVVKP
jgi:hypothetical protein